MNSIDGIFIIIVSVCKNYDGPDRLITEILEKNKIKSNVIITKNEIYQQHLTCGQDLEKRCTPPNRPLTTDYNTYIFLNNNKKLLTL